MLEIIGALLESEAEAEKKALNKTDSNKRTIAAVLFATGAEDAGRKTTERDNRVSLSNDKKVRGGVNFG